LIAVRVMVADLGRVGEGSGRGRFRIRRCERGVQDQNFQIETARMMCLILERNLGGGGGE
jgi:DNA-binding transcriptional regulator of glucitol operon